MPLAEPESHPLGLQREVVLAGADFDLHPLGLGHMRFRLDFPCFFLLEVLVLAKIHNFGNGWLCVRRYLDEVKTGLSSVSHGLVARDDPQIRAISADNPQFERPD